MAGGLSGAWGTAAGGRIYLEDYYDAKSIEIDQSIYLGIKYRLHPMWKPVNQKAEERRTLLYLLRAFEQFTEIMI